MSDEPQWSAQAAVPRDDTPLSAAQIAEEEEENHDELS